MREVQAFNRAEENIEQFRVTNAANRDANVRAVAFTSALAPALEALGYLALAIVVLRGRAGPARNGTLFGTAVSLGLVITFLAYVQRFNQPIQQIAVLWTNIQSAIAGAERIFGLLDEKPAIADAPDAKALSPIRGEVEFRNVTAEYKEGEPVLKNVSFHGRTRTDHRHRRSDRRRQDHHHQPDPALLRCDRRLRVRSTASMCAM